MKKEILQFLVNAIQNEKTCALITVVCSSGHAPGREGFSMAVTEDSLLGTIGGGTIEKNMVNKARKFIAQKISEPKYFHRIHKISAGENSSGMICGGSQSVVICPINEKSLSVLEECLSAFENSTPKVFCISSSGIQCLSEKRHENYSFANMKENDWLYEEVIDQRNRAYIFGGGHVCLALSPILSSLGFRVIVLDERPFINTITENSNINELIISPFETLPNMVKEGENSYAFIMTPSHLHDETVLRGLLHKDLKYLGMMASKTKVAEIFEKLRKDGVSEALLFRVKSPIGLSIKSKTAEEIAVSIAAEVIQIKNSS